MVRKLTILATPINAVGHVNATSGALIHLLTRGHRVIFVLEEAFRDKLAKLGYEEFIYNGTSKKPEEKPKENGEIGSNPGEKMAQMLVDMKIIGPFSPLEKMQNMWKNMQKRGESSFLEDLTHQDAAVKKAIAEFKPDIIYHDGMVFPSIYYSNVPWIHQVSTTPIFWLADNHLPPGGSGLPANDRSRWNEYDEVRKEFKVSPAWNDWIEEMGYERFPGDVMSPETHALTVHAYPEELNYDGIRAKGWFNLEVFNKGAHAAERVKLSSLVPDTFLDDTLDGRWSGKLIYVSMGSMGSVDLDLMKRLVAALGKTNHKYIVSKGPRHAEYELDHPNLWGDRYLPQTSLLPHMDAVITHGGNNTVTETFVHGKPMLVLPLFADQFDNAQRLHETGLGARIEPYEFTDEELSRSLDKLLHDAELVRKLERAARRIQQSSKHQELAIRIEQLVNQS